MNARHYPAFHAECKIQRACKDFTAFPLQVNHKILQLALNVCQAETEGRMGICTDKLPDFFFSERVPSSFEPQPLKKKQLWEHILLKGMTVHNLKAVGVRCA